MSVRRGQNQEPLAGALKELESALASFAPAPARLDRDRLMFAAGAASRAAKVPLSHPHAGHARRARALGSSARRLPLATTAAAMLAAVFAVLYAVERHRAPVIVRDVGARQGAARPASAAPAARGARSGPVPAGRQATAVAVTTPAPGIQPGRAIRAPVAGVPPIIDRNPLWTYGPWRLIAAPSTNYFALRHVLLDRGVEALPPYQPPTTPSPSGRQFPVERHEPATIRNLMKEFVPARATKMSAAGLPGLRPSTAGTTGGNA